MMTTAQKNYSALKGYNSSNQIVEEIPSSKLGATQTGYSTMEPPSALLTPGSPLKRQSTLNAAEINLDKITPEFAAKIVKHFVLPMFENSASSKVGRRLGQKHTLAQNGGIYSELKLSDQLNETLAEVRNEVTSLSSSLEEA